MIGTRYEAIYRMIGLTIDEVKNKQRVSKQQLISLTCQYGKIIGLKPEEVEKFLQMKINDIINCIIIKNKNV